MEVQKDFIFDWSTFHIFRPEDPVNEFVTAITIITHSRFITNDIYKCFVIGV